MHALEEDDTEDEDDGEGEHDDRVTASCGMASCEVELVSGAWWKERGSFKRDGAGEAAGTGKSALLFRLDPLAELPVVGVVSVRNTPAPRRGGGPSRLETSHAQLGCPPYSPAQASGMLTS
mgnify:CR=1 FL=1